MSARVISVINQKGGVGKTTTTVNLAHALANMGRKVMIIDLDPQGHLAVSLGAVDSRKTGVDEVLLGQASLEQQLVSIRKNLSLVVSGPKLCQIEQPQSGGPQQGLRLKDALQQVKTDQDFIFIDCPPSSGVLIFNALVAADEILIPMASDFLSLQGLAFLVKTIRRFEKTLRRKYKVQLVISRFIPTRRLSRDVIDTLIKHFPGQILATVIRETSLLAECPGLGKTIHEYRAGSRSARDFRSLACDFLDNKVM